MSREREAISINGWIALGIHLLLVACTLFMYGTAIRGAADYLCHPTTVAQEYASLAPMIPVIFLLAFLIFLLKGYFTLPPNSASVMMFFGSYAGTVRHAGLHWTIPFFKRNTLSLRLQSIQGPVLKVNDKQGNPIEISLVLVYHIEDTAQAQFDVHNFKEYVSIQSESALRHLATNYAYDHADGEELTLRASTDVVSQALQVELQERLSKAGARVDEARITHLAYAPEIAMAMLRRQQAFAVIAARRQIVEGAVSIVNSTLLELSKQDLVEFNNDRKAAMVSNLLVVLCSESQVQPVINAS
ncbi:MAG: SPFH domain-containing protein [Candidatus Obscuribacterales bacterium]|nr:SPFH domain-containing protein [Candidatus Obscuribacterales bacterium]